MLARRRTKVRRVAKFVRSIKHYFLYFLNFAQKIGVLQVFCSCRTLCHILFYAVCAFFTSPFFFRFCVLCVYYMCITHNFHADFNRN